MKRLANKAAGDLATLGPDAATFTRAYKALEADIHASLAGTPAAGAYDLFRAQYRIQKKLVDDALDKAAVEQTNTIFHNVFEARDGELGDEVAYILGQHPEARTKFRSAIFDHWRNYAMTNGRVDPARHADWLAKWGEMAQPYFPKTVFQMLDSASSAEAAFRQATESEKAVLANIASSFGGRLTSLEPAQVYRFLWGPNKAGELAQFKRIAPPEAVDALRRAVLNSMEYKITSLDRTTGTREISFAKLESYLAHGDTGVERELRVLFGDTYVNDLKVLRDAANIAQREPVTVNRSGTALLSGEAEKQQRRDLMLTLLRIRYGPMAHESFAVVQLMKLRKRKVDQVVYDAIMDPALLRQMVELRDVKPGSM
ncbi:MAG: hypothetical protein ACRD3R_13605, partial [Terriglobales bacterium]